MRNLYLLRATQITINKQINKRLKLKWLYMYSTCTRQNFNYAGNSLTNQLATLSPAITFI